ncbi:MAG: PAS-domain containing protein, partial [Pseudomonadota bacterium]
GAVDLSGYTEEEFVAFATKQRLEPGEPTMDRLDDGRVIRFAGRRLSNGSTIFIQSDVTEMTAHQDRAEAIGKRLTSRTAQLESAVDAMQTGFVMFDADSRMIMSNEAYGTMLGFPEGVLKPGVSRATLIDIADREKLFDPKRIEESRSNYADSVHANTPRTFRYYMTDGRVLEFRYTPMSDGGSILLCTDISGRLASQQKLERYSRTLERSNAELQNFAYVASHDLQEPLRKIEAFGDRLAKKHGDAIPESGQLYLDRIQDAATRMRALINDLLSFSRVSSKARTLEDISLSEVMAGVMSDLQMALEESGATVECHDLPVIEADPMQMRQLFQNLLANALKFVKPDVPPLIRVSANTATREIVGGQHRQVVVLTFSDNGIGFEPRFAEQIFTIFQRLHGRAEYEGTGIGLATCRKIVERHAGTITATGEAGVGATFTIELPARQPEQEL